jgi:glycosyltransferase involved in cell wall biosynthesis
MQQPGELHVAGYLPPERTSWLEDLRAKHGFTYDGSPDFDGKVRFLQSMDVLSVPTVYREPKGFFVLEAMACGTPVVQPAHGAFPEIVSKTGGGLLTAPGNHDELAARLDFLASDPSALAELSDRAKDGVRRHFDLPPAARRALEVYQSVARPLEVR